LVYFRTVAPVRGRAVVAGFLCWLAVGCAGDTPSNEAPSATLGAGPATTAASPTTSPPTSPPTTAQPATTTTSTTAAPTVEDEVEAAYLRSWDVYTDAMLRLDPARLAEVYTGAALETRHDEIADLATARTPARMRVEHDFEVVVVDETNALVLERYRDHSVLLDGTTMEPLGPDPDAVVSREYVLHREAEGWRVARINAAS
jgi:hypothetical protein